MWQKILAPADLGIILSYHCQAKCKHCLYACGPEWKEWINPQELEKALTTTTFWQHPFRIHLTGGEPFLNFPLLIQAVKIANQLNIPQYVETNAGWCTEESKVREKFATLKQTGLKAILISCSPFQAEKIPLKRPLLAIRVALEIFGPNNVIVYLPHCIDQVKQFSIDQTVPIQAYIEKYGEEKTGNMLWNEYGLIPGGMSSYQLGHLTKKYPPDRFKGRTCFSEILFAHHSHFDLYGNYISWFCGGLTIGDWHNLPEIIEHFSKQRFPPLIDVLITKGPYGLFELTKQEYGYQPIPDGYTSKCHLCVDVRKHLVNFNQFAELRPKQFYQML